MQINKKRLEKAKETLKKLTERKVGEINEAQVVFCASLKCFLITGEYEMADRAIDMLLTDLNMEPEEIMKTMKSIKLTEEYIAITMKCVRDGKLVKQAFNNFSVN